MRALRCPFARMYKESARREMTYFRYSYTFSIGCKKLFDVLLYEESRVFPNLLPADCRKSKKKIVIIIIIIYIITS